GNSVGTRSFDINITLMGKSETERVEIAHDLNNLIIQTNSFESEIIFDDEPEWIYYGHFAQMAELTELQTDNYTTTITFICSDPRGYGEQQEISLPESPAIIEVAGSQSTSPIIHAIATDDLTSLSFATDDDYIFLGADIDPDTGQTAVKMYENVLSDRANDMTLWDGIGQSNITW
ncbi:distal tail protein Dit, partial [Listeria monocytogenes]